MWSTPSSSATWRCAVAPPVLNDQNLDLVHPQELTRQIVHGLRELRMFIVTRNLNDGLQMDSCVRRSAVSKQPMGIPAF